MISGWKKTAIENMAAAFEAKMIASPPISEQEVGKLHARIGQLVVERDLGRCLQSRPRNWRQKAVNRNHSDVSVRRQCALLCLTRSPPYYQPRGKSAGNLRFMEIIDKQFLETVAELRHRFEQRWRRYGSRQMARHMQREGHECGRHRVRRLMKLMRLVPICQEPRTSKKHPELKIYRSPLSSDQWRTMARLLKDLRDTRPNRVWCTDITYIPIIPVRRGFLCLVAIMDWHSRKVLGWRLSNTMEAEVCVEALKEALAQYGPPDFFIPIKGRNSPALISPRC